MRPRDFEDILSRLPGAKQSGDSWTAPCNLSGHKTPAGHLTLKDAGDKALVTCQGGKHSYQDYCQAWGFDSLTYSDNGIGGSTTNGRPCQPVNGRAKQAQNRVDTPLSTVVNGVNLTTLAEAKHLPVDFLKSLGMSDFKYNGQPSVKIPYYAEDGTERAVRFRLALTAAEGTRFKWRKGDHAMPYGLNRLIKIRKAGWVLIVEGESDCWTCWFHSIPALGAPGKGTYPPAWGEYLKGLDVFVWQEPDAEDFVLRVLKGTPELRYIPAPDGIKDISEAHIQGLDVPSWLEDLKAKSESGQALKAQNDNERLGQLYIKAKAVIEAEDPLELISAAIRGLGYGGDIRPTIIVYLAATSRLLAMRDGAMPVHLLIMGISSSGKSYTLRVVLILFPAEAYHVISAGSPRTIIYDDTDLQHRLLVFGEADSLPAGEDNPAASAIRNLLQDHSLHWEVTIRDADTGDFTVRKVVKPGPTVLITTSTRSLGAQLMTRLFTLEIGDSKEQIEAALKTQAALEIEGSKPLDGSLVSFQAYLQLKAPFKVIVPYAGELANGMAKMASAPRILRDFARLLSLIKSVAIIRHHWRETDNDGRLVATLTDYETVRELVNDMYIDSSTGATSEIRALVDAVRALDATRGNGGQITNTTLAKHLATGVKQVTRRAGRAIKAGWLVNREQRKFYPADYAPGEPMPEVEGLPVLEGLTGLTSLDTPLSMNSEAKNEGVDRLTHLTVGDIPPPPDTDLPPVPNHPCHDCGKDEWSFEEKGGTVYSKCASCGIVHYPAGCPQCREG
ncbi:MAG: hypothetical protein Q8O43_04135 [Dehalococcoidia bacterium]|nr:hypothetical protein [Dehalococcoidia bacterium]